MIEILSYIIFGLIISMLITYFIAIHTSMLKKMSDEDILNNVDRNLNITDIYSSKKDAVSKEATGIIGAFYNNNDN